MVALVPARDVAVADTAVEVVGEAVAMALVRERCLVPSSRLASARTGEL